MYQLLIRRNGEVILGELYVLFDGRESPANDVKQTRTASSRVERARDDYLGSSKKAILGDGLRFILNSQK